MITATILIVSGIVVVNQSTASADQLWGISGEELNIRYPYISLGNSQLSMNPISNDAEMRSGIMNDALAPDFCWTIVSSIKLCAMRHITLRMVMLRSSNPSVAITAIAE